MGGEKIRWVFFDLGLRRALTRVCQIKSGSKIRSGRPPTRWSTARSCTRQQEEQSTRGPALSRPAGSHRGGARVSEAAGWFDRTAAHLHSWSRALRRARAALRRAGRPRDEPVSWSPCEERSDRHTSLGRRRRPGESVPDTNRKCGTSRASNSPCSQCPTATTCTRPSSAQSVQSLWVQHSGGVTNRARGVRGR